MPEDYVRGGRQKESYGPDEVESVECPLCSADRPIPLHTEHGSLRVCRCGSCNLIYTSPRPRSPEEVYWGSADAYLSEARLVFEGRANHHRDPNYLEEIREIERLCPPGRLLDVGSNMGMLLRLALTRGWDVTGVEPSPSLSKLSKRWGFSVFNCFLHELPASQEESFDVVAFSDVFEHVTDPKGFLAAARRVLKPGGLLYVKVPNARWTLLKQRLIKALRANPNRTIWDAYEHVVHYTDATLPRMLREGGFEVVRLTGARPVQSPNWQEWVGHYYQYPTPWFMDSKRKAVRLLFHYLSYPERLIRLGGLGPCSQNLVALARRE